MTKTQWKKVWALFNARVKKRDRQFFYPSWRLQKRMIEQSVAQVLDRCGKKRSKK